jgi:putative restriction endonuclease
MLHADLAIRWAAVQNVLAVRERWSGIPAAELKSFRFADRTILLKSIQGVFKPREFDLPLSITSTLASPYTDRLVDGTKILYDYAPRSREYDNNGLKECVRRRLPLIYLMQVKPKPSPEYLVFAPVYIESWDDDSRQFLVNLSEQALVRAQSEALADSDSFFGGHLETLDSIDKGYVSSIAQRRLHQAKFRNQVLGIYRERCAVCVLRVRPLLDAAHVVPDKDPKPTIVVNEGLALCATHHRAFDARILRYDAKYRIRIDLPSGTNVGEGERSMLLAFDGRPLGLPRDERFWPVVVEN